jgi:hypothetical protein
MKYQYLAFGMIALVLVLSFASAIILPGDDSDGDGVNDDVDLCANTPVGDVVNADGCSISQICNPEAVWKNHGGYVSCVAHTANSFVALGLITEEEKGVIVSTAAQTSIGK